MRVSGIQAHMQDSAANSYTYTIRTIDIYVTIGTTCKLQLPSFHSVSSPGKISSGDAVSSTLLDVKLVSPISTHMSFPEGCTLYCCTVVRILAGFGWPDESNDRGP